MALDLRLTLSQRLVMTPQLQQAIKLLQLSRMELEQAVREELEVNPVLEELPEGAPGEGIPDEGGADDPVGEQLFDEAPAAPVTERGDASTETAADPKDENSLIDRVDWDYFFGEGANFEGGGTRDREDEDGRPYYENTLTRSETLVDYLEEQVNLSDFDPALRETACYLIGNIDENGYLQVSSEETAAALETTVEVVDRVVAFIQTLDPPGIGGRDLRECLMIQARLKGDEFALPLRILSDHFDLFSKGDVAGLARKLKLDKEAVKGAFQKIVMLWPKPGRAFSGEEAQQIIPDAYVTKIGNDWVITLNDDGQPRLRLSGYYRRLLQDSAALGKEDREFLKQKINSALWFIKSIDQRQRTIYKVVESIMKLQRDFLDRGPKYLKPLTLRDVAEEIEMHESTVSRVTSGKYVYTPHGIFELKYFFNSGLNRDGGEENIASKSVKEKIREIIAAESGSGKRLSDQELMRLLRNQGIHIARRTVTKYRGQLGLLAAARRKKIF
ncbi:MAG TPA: RNA polymerase factor sigma-54 [Candidatus Deferrimicrobiaceae bacterium]|jgi:RNA polymerase sigma-54 factor